MRYIIIRRRIKIALLFALLAVSVILFIPWFYENFFVHDENLGIADFNLVLEDFLTQNIPENNKNISLDLNFLNNGYISSKIDIEDMELKGIKISADIFTKGRIIKDKQGAPVGFSGKLFSRNITLNSNPFLPLGISFRIIKDRLEIISLRLGKSYKLKGKITMVKPFTVDLRLEIVRADMRTFLAMAKIKGRNIVPGIVSGLFYIKGSLTGNIFSEGFIESRNGKIGPIRYDLVRLKLEGFGPVINIVDSNIKEQSGTLTIEGYVDLRNIAERNVFDGLRFKSDMKTIVWNDWDITKEGTDELSLEKDISDKMRVGFKTISRRPFTTYYDEENPEEMNLEYKMGLESLKLKLKENEEFFGIEHSMKF